MTLKPFVLPCVVTLASAPVMAETARELAAHEHGHGALNIAIEGDVLAMELEVPGFDIVGFEHEAKSDADKKAVQEAIAQLSDIGSVFAFPQGAGCELVDAKVTLLSDADEAHEDHAEDHHEEDDHKHDHDDHGHEKHDHDAEGHEGHDHDKHDHDEHDHAAQDHDDHHDHAKEHDHDGHAHHDEHDHDDHAAHTENHTEFHAEYHLTCAAIDKLDEIGLPYFTLFKNAKELEVQLVHGALAKRVEASADVAIVPLK